MAPGGRSRRTHGLTGRSTMLVSLLLIGLLALAGALVQSAAAAAIVVNSTGDTQANDGTCTLREAIFAANNNTASGLAGGECIAGTAGADIITFSIAGAGPHIISPATDLPPFIEPVTINGYSQNGSFANTLGLASGSNAIVQIQIDGGGVRDFGLTFNDGSDGSTVQGLSIVQFNQVGILTQLGADGIFIQGNMIGLNAPIGATLGGNGTGIRLSANATVGGSTVAARNIISGNDTDGIKVADGDNTLIDGNLIGTNRAADNIRGNGNDGILTFPDASNVTIGTSAVGNVISGNSINGIEVNDTPAVYIRSNRIGTTGDGTLPLGNLSSGIVVTSGASVNIGGTAAGEGNLISGNGQFGIQAADTVDLTVYGNTVGLNLAGTTAIPNASAGVVLQETNRALVGDGVSGLAGNVISGNGGPGIVALTTTGVTSPIIRANRIGTSADGLTDRGNGASGIAITSILTPGGGVTIGGASSGEGNLISGNSGFGVEVADAAGVTLLGNIIGLNANQTAPMKNDDGGIYLCNCVGPTVIGGTAASAPNMISGNDNHGILMEGVIGATVQNNRIGTDLAGTGVFGNQADGIRMELGALNNTIGGTGTNERNIIANNGGVGVNVIDPTSFGNAIRANLFRANSRSIDLNDDGATANDGLDADAGPNDLQNFPVLTNAISVGGGTQVAGSLTTTAATTLAIDIYASSSCDPFANSLGSVYLGSVSVLTNGSGVATFDQLVGAAPPGSTLVSATASRSNGTGSTSEFSACLTLQVATPTITLTPTITQTPTVTPTGTLQPTSTPTPTATPTVAAVQLSGGDDKGGPPTGNSRKSEKESSQQRTEEQRQQDERTNRYGQDQYRVEGNVKELRTVNGEQAVILANRDGDVVVILRCKDQCPTIKVGDYIIAEGEKEHEQLFFAESVSIQKPGH